MSRPPAAREKVLTAFAAIVAEQGEQAATMDAVAARAGVSKGGLLYHFASREALVVDGLLARLLQDGEADVLAMRAAPEGAVRYYLATSADSPRELIELYVAASRITQTGADAARRALAHLESQWLAALVDEVGDEPLARLLAVVGDGLYLRAVRGEQREATAAWREIEPVIDALLAHPPDQQSTGRAR